MEKTLSFIPFTIIERKYLCRLVFACILISLLASFFSRTLIHQLGSPSIRYPYVDPTYWLYILSGIPSFLTTHKGMAILFDMSLFGFCLLVLLMPQRRLFILLFFLLYGIYFLTFDLYGNARTGGKVAVLLASVPFIVSDAGLFTLLWGGLRYFYLFIYSDAFLWKLLRGTWLRPGQGSQIMRENLVPYFYFHPSTPQAHLYYWFLQHPSLTDRIFQLGVAGEGLFLIGFFTRKFDKYLLALSFLMPLGFFFFADAFFFELLILSLTLIDWPAILGRTYFWANRLR